MAQRQPKISEEQLREKNFYLTKPGLAKLGKERQALLAIKNYKTQNGVPSVLHSEELDPEYLAFSEDMEYLEMRLADLEYVLKHRILIKTPSRKERNKVSLGAKVLVEINGATDEFEMVGTLEANPSLGRVSNESPVGQALLGHKAGDEVIVSSPIKTTYRIKKIKYHES